MSAKIERLRELLADATPGPWEAWPSTACNGMWCIASDGIGFPASSMTHSDAQLVVGAVNALPELLNAAEALKRVRALHEDEWSCGNPRHINPEVGCPDCALECKACGDHYPCPTIRAIERKGRN